MKLGPLIAKAWLASSKLAEVSGSHWAYRIEELEDDPSSWFRIDGHIELGGNQRGKQVDGGRLTNINVSKAGHCRWKRSSCGITYGLSMFTLSGRELSNSTFYTGWTSLKIGNVRTKGWPHFDLLIQCNIECNIAPCTWQTLSRPSHYSRDRVQP